MRERDIIAALAPLASGEPGSFSLKDDAAMLAVPPLKHLVVTTDSVIEGIHLIPQAGPQHYASKLVRRNLSDLAAMGAEPWRYFLNLHLPHRVDEAWLQAFVAALAEEQRHFGMLLAGGDTTRGGKAIHLTLTCLGLIDAPALTRHGAKPGDHVYVSGTIGDAALGLLALQQDLEAQGYGVTRYFAPQPRLELGTKLRGIATAAIDCSDGLLKDLATLCHTSEVGLKIALEAIPLSAEVQQLFYRTDPEMHSALWQSLLTGGDDYELIFTAPASAQEHLQALAKLLDLPLTRIGKITAEPSLLFHDGQQARPFGADQGFEY